MVLKFTRADGAVTRGTSKIERRFSAAWSSLTSEVVEWTERGRRLASMFRGEPGRSSTLLVAVEAAFASGAGWVMGEITLPVPVAWGDREVPEGRYTLVAPAWPPMDRVFLQGGGHHAEIVPVSVEGRPRARKSVLALVDNGTTYHVRSLQLRDPGIVFHFDVLSPAPWPHDAAGRRRVIVASRDRFGGGRTEAVGAYRA